ncbi:unnamed protein product [Spirodela intermedia]|uniref:Uncharacterized protein n=1 Tax=Spirodela intermedia TaxID=51605 RepID=A0A7I8K211_SPIIN|nr:unnamed protein product [Spirodela intermedia]
MTSKYLRSNLDFKPLGAGAGESDGNGDSDDGEASDGEDE